MIVRIKKIQQVGVFHDFTSGGPVSFNEHGKITVIFGRNRKGKTTLSSIFQSIGSGNADLINRRVSIPANPKLTRHIEITYKDGDSEDTILFNTTGWDREDLKGRVIVFDQDFVHKNLMLGEEVTRENKENLTDFILGEDGVKKSEDIGIRKKSLREALKILPQSNPDFVRDKSKEDVLGFIGLKVNPNELAKIDKDIADLDKKLSRLEDVKEFQQIAVVQKLLDHLPATLIDSMQSELVAVFDLSYDDVKEKSEKVLKNHLKNHVTGEDANEWIQQGQQYSDSKHCPFCGQDVAPVQALFNAYGEIFTEEFRKYVDTLNANINSGLSRLENAKSCSLIDARLDLLAKLRRYLKYIPEISEESLRAIEDDLKGLKSTELDFVKELDLWHEKVLIDISNKRDNLGKSIKPNDVPDSLKTCADSLTEPLQSIDKSINLLIDAITVVSEKLAKLTSQQIAIEIDDIKKDIHCNQERRSRIIQNDQCQKFITLFDAIEKERKDIDDAIISLESEQSDYLIQYFDRLNFWFDHFGSDGFTINKTTNNLGDKKVYSLDVKYNDQPINSVDLHRIFSESDRRNLALSLFMARIEKENIKNNKIIVFDDPVVSFDDNRIKQTCLTLKNISESYQQMIILTHYGSVVKRLYGSNSAATYIEIDKQGTGSVIRKMDVETFCSSAREKEYDKIQQFIDGKDTSNIVLSLRPFLEGSLKDRFRKQLIGMGRYDSKIWEIIEELKNANCITSEVATQLFNMKDTLNPDHHATDDDENSEDTRNLAKNLLKIIYEDI